MWMSKMKKTFWTIEQQKAFEELCTSEKLNPERLQTIIGDYIFYERLPLRDDIVETLETNPNSLKEKL